MIPAEEAILSASILSSGECLVGLNLTGNDFSTRAGGLLFDLIKSMAETSRPADLITITQAIRELPSDEKRAYPAAPALNALFAMGASGAAVPFHAALVAGEAARRRLISTGQYLIQYGNEGMDVDILADKALELVQGAVAGVSTTVDSIGVTLADTINSFGEPVTYSETPWPSINHLMQGWRPGGLYVIGARPSVGKTIAGLQAAIKLTALGPVAFISLEMSEVELQKRMISLDAKIDIGHVTRNNLTDEDTNRMAPSIQRWEAMPLYVDKTHGAKFTDISRHVWSVKRQHGLAAVVIDYLQLMEPSDPKKNEYQTVTENSRKLKLLAQQLDVPVIALSQLNRSSEQRDGKVPQLSDLRASGGVEQDADVVILLHRDLMKSPHEIELIVAKNRHGVTGTADMDFCGYYSEIRDRQQAA
ncbi:replicative DNA helicase [Arthrobacter alpinus]|uniref:DNA 5'-3' helicase n=1 Tax=Arthrobacter alpinus TaxID=656366 RepID=A0A1H5H116_9MICC|nr:DnaB-like helicase C-terminal domain-containing protein [Arthrobacter alpinus]SEE20958.1 replicative DNA helicase [Arthrobacter alpinus]